MKSEKKQQVKPLSVTRPALVKAQKELTELEVKKALAKKPRKGKVSSQNVPPVEIQLDGLEFNPLLEEGLYLVAANLPTTTGGTRQIALSHRNSAQVDCGFNAKIPSGYRLVVELSSNFKDHGIEIYKNSFIGENRISFSIRNLGREIVVINHRDRVGYLRIEPIYPLTLKIVEESDHDK